jgi:hypothetical protein
MSLLDNYHLNFRPGDDIEMILNSWLEDSTFLITGYESEEVLISTSKYLQFDNEFKLIRDRIEAQIKKYYQFKPPKGDLNKGKSDKKTSNKKSRKNFKYQRQ